MHVAVLTDLLGEGGANIAGYRVTEALASAGHRITALYERTPLQCPWDSRLIPSGLATHRLPWLQRRIALLVPYEVRRARHQQQAAEFVGRTLADLHPDVVHVHNLHISTWSMEMLRAAAHVAPVVCTLHDTWMLTGRCVYPGTCTKYLDGCDASCPTASEYPAVTPSRIAAEWELRRDLLTSGANITAVAPSDWLAELAVGSLWRTRPVFKIPYALNLQQFEPADRAVARQAEGLRTDERVLLAAATDLTSPRKGVRHLFEALAAGIDRPLRLLLLGSPADVPPLPPNVAVQQLGFVADDSRRARIYNCADLFVHTALADNAPLTVMEAHACGTPVVAFPVDGLPETVLDERTGWMAAGTGTDFLRAALTRALDALDAGIDLRQSCRAFAESRYAPADVARQYTTLFEALRGGRVNATGQVQHVGLKGATS